MTSFLPESFQKGLYSDATPLQIYKALAEQNPTPKQQRIIKFQRDLYLINIREVDNYSDYNEYEVKLSSYEYNDLSLAQNYYRVKMDELPPNIGKLESLDSLIIINQKIKSFPQSIHDAPKLRVIYVRGWDEIYKFPVPQPGQTHVLNRLEYLAVPREFRFTPEEQEIIQQKHLDVIYLLDSGTPYETETTAFVTLDSPKTAEKKGKNPVYTNASFLEEEPVEVEAHYETGGRKSRKTKKTKKAKKTKKTKKAKKTKKSRKQRKGK